MLISKRLKFDFRKNAKFRKAQSIKISFELGFISYFEIRYPTNQKLEIREIRNRQKMHIRQIRNILEF